MPLERRLLYKLISKPSQARNWSVLNNSDTVVKAHGELGRGFSRNLSTLIQSYVA